jgi:hypothetical protein
MRLRCFNRLNLILRRPRSGRLEGWAAKPIFGMTAMANSEDSPPPVGAYWIREEDYPALLEIFEDGSKMPPTWQEWLKMAEEMERGLTAYGHVVLRVYIDPRTFPDWCAAHGTTPGSAGRRKFVAAAVLERFGDQS